MKSIMLSIFIFATNFMVNSFASACIDSAELACVSSSASCSERFSIQQDTDEVWRNFSLNNDHCNVDHAIIVLHGRDRNPEDYFTYAVAAAQKAGRLDRTLIISPAFREQNDLKNATDLYWDRSTGSAALNDWVMGGQSAGPSSTSSYQVIDKIVESIAKSGHFPNLKSVVIAGHSAGGQFAHRYALVGNMNNQGLNLAFGYVSANPSSYAYLNDLRPISGSLIDFAIPVLTSCNYWNEWGYGLIDPNTYIKNSSLTDQQIIAQYTGRRLTYLLGDADTSADGMDTTCSANLQGINRYERGTAYSNYIQAYYPTAKHTRSVVPGVGHSGSKMLTSSQGVEALYTVAQNDPVQADTIAPTTSISNLVDGQYVTKGYKFTIKASASDNVKVAKVEFYVNDKLVCSDSTASYTCTWSVPRTAGVKYRLHTKAYDFSGNSDTSLKVYVTSK
ncbi:MAG: Ig-like domain-containing protein [Candidatus Nitrotoga sp.]